MLSRPGSCRLAEKATYAGEAACSRGYRCASARRIHTTRTLQPRWKGDDVLNRFRYADLVRGVGQHGFTVRDGVRFNWIYWAWELLPLAIGLESALRKPLARWGAHCWLVAERRGAS
jgi:hypothetical protein